jgi:hypothetical protein
MVHKARVVEIILHPRTDGSIEPNETIEFHLKGTQGRLTVSMQEVFRSAMRGGLGARAK